MKDNKLKELLEVVKQLVELVDASKERTNEWQQLAKDAKNGLNKQEIDNRKKKLDSAQVIDFSSILDKLSQIYKSL